jgi:hypothetical protein
VARLRNAGKTSLACGDDGINHQILKSTSEFICIYLTFIFLFFTATERHIQGKNSTNERKISLPNIKIVENCS